MTKNDCIKRIENFISGLYESLDYPENKQKQEWIDNINYDIETFETALKIIRRK